MRKEVAHTVFVIFGGYGLEFVVVCIFGASDVEFVSIVGSARAHGSRA
jgi:hypothetical protein